MPGSYEGVYNCVKVFVAVQIYPIFTLLGKKMSNQTACSVILIVFAVYHYLACAGRFITYI